MVAPMTDNYHHKANGLSSICCRIFYQVCKLKFCKKKFIKYSSSKMNKESKIFFLKNQQFLLLDSLKNEKMSKSL